jgi:hypothetical protein
MANISKTELAELLASDSRSIHDARYYTSRYTVAELLALVDAYGYNDLYCRDARKLFDAVAWSRSLRTNKSLWLRVEEREGDANAGILR